MFALLVAMVTTSDVCFIGSYGDLFCCMIYGQVALLVAMMTTSDVCFIGSYGDYL